MVIWFTGLSGSGKSTLSGYLKIALEKDGFSVLQVDGDLFREKNKADFTRKGIIENNLRIVSHCNEVKKDYDFLIVSVISPYQETRDIARKLFDKEYVEIFLNSPLEVLVKNDTKGLYARAKKGEIKDLIGFSEGSPYETPKNPELEIRTDKMEVGKSVEIILEHLKKRGIKL